MKWKNRDKKVIGLSVPIVVVLFFTCCSMNSKNLV